jgi:hypothetical protein
MKKKDRRNVLLALPEALSREIEKAKALGKKDNLSEQDILRMAIRRGLPVLEEMLSAQAA